MAVGLMSRVGPRAASAYISVSGDFSPFDRQIKNEAGKSKQRFAAIGKAAAAGIAVGIAVGGKAAVNAAVDLGEQINKTKVVFRGHEQTVLRWSKTTATAIGTSRREALEAAGTFGNMLVPMGFSRKEAAGMSKTFVTLAADMASFNNASPADTLDAIRAGLAGETEPLRRYGIFLNDARLKQEALNLGLKDSVGPTGALTASAKAQATYSLILKDSADTQGDFKRTSGSLANQQRILKAQVEDVGAAVGKELIPVLTDAARFTSKFIKQMQTGKGPGGEFAAVVTDLADGAKQAGQFVGPVLGDIAHFAKEHPSLLKAAGAVGAIALGVKGIKGAGKLTGLTDLIGVGKGALGRGGGGIVGKATPVPVFVTNMGGMPGPKPGGPKVPPIVTGAGKVATVAAAASRAVPLIAAGSIIAWVAWKNAGNNFPTGPGARGPSSPTGRAERGRPQPGTGLPGADWLNDRDRGGGLGGTDPGGQARTSGRRTLAIRNEIRALEDRVIAGRRLVERLKTEGASTEDVSRAQRRARERTMDLKQAQLRLAEQTGASSAKIQRLRGEIEKLRSKRISVAVDINIPSLNVRAKGNLSGSGPQGPGMHTGDPGIGKYIEGKVAKKAKAAAEANPMALLGLMGNVGIVAVGRLLQGLGYQVGENPAFGGVDGVHVPGSYHYRGRAIDVNADNFPGGEGPALDAIYPLLQRLPHSELLWRTEDHFDHLHYAMQRGGIIPGVGDGDKHLVAAEPGEGFINKKAVKAMGGPSAIDAINRMVPRFGGMQIAGASRLTRLRRKLRRAKRRLNQLYEGGITAAEKPVVIELQKYVTELVQAIREERLRRRNASPAPVDPDHGFSPTMLGFQTGGTVPKEYARLFRMAQGRFKVPANVLAGLTWIESKFDRNAVSRAGARGATQFMPGTAPAYGVEFGSSHHALATQIFGAAKYLNALGFQSDRRGALAKYNGGPGNPQYGYADDVIAAAAGYAGIGAGAGSGSGPGEDARNWNWAEMGNKRRGVFVKGRKKSMDVGRERFARLARQNKINWKRTKHRKGDRGALQAFPGAGRGRGTGRPWRMPSAGSVLEAFIGQAAEQLALREARAALTDDKNVDDLAVAQDAAQMWRHWLGVAEKNKADAPTITGILQNIKAADDAVAGFTGDASNAALEENNRLLAERNELDKQLVKEQQLLRAVMDTQGPTLLAAVIAAVNGGIGGLTGLGSQTPSFAGVGGLANY